jgi:Domain of unknown function (DUF4145)
MANEEIKLVDKKIVKANCPVCDGERNCTEHGAIYKRWNWKDNYHGHSMDGGVDHSLLECMGCETVFYVTESWNSEDIDHYYDASGELQTEAVKEFSTYPKPEAKNKPIWFDAMQKKDFQLHNILKQMYIALDNQAHILTAIALRTALDRATEVLGIDPAKNFDEKLSDLRDGGWIGQTERDILGVVTDAGNAAAHRGWEPDNQEVTQLVSSMEVFLHRAFIVGQDALGIRGNLPIKPKRLLAPEAVAAT